MELFKAELTPVTLATDCAMIDADQAMWEERGDTVTKDVLLLLNSKNDNAKKDLRLYSKGDKSAYPLIAKAMTSYMLTQYPNKNPGHQPNGKIGVQNGKKGDNSKPEDQDNNTTGTVGAHIREVTTPEDFTAPSGGSSISAHILKVFKQTSWPAWSVESLLGAHFINDDIWGGNDLCNVSIDTLNNAKIIAGSQITEEHIFIFCRSDLHELLNVIVHVPCEFFWSQYFELYFPDNYHDWNQSPNAINTINSGVNIVEAHFAKHQHQNYYGQREQQSIILNYNGGLEQVISELAPSIILEEEDVYNQ